MPMSRTYGSRRMDRPEGMLREIHFPTLALTDTRTGDGRELVGEGGGTRELPVTVYGQFVNDPGHSSAVIIGTLDVVEFDGEGNVSGWGWLLDDDNGRQAVIYLKTLALTGNSVDLADVTASYKFDEERDEIYVEFEQWKIAATTLVGKPAFADARAELTEETTAALLADETPLEVGVPSTFEIAVADELVADGAPKPAWDIFHRPEADKPTKSYISPEPNADGFYEAWGHLALWESCHDGVAGRCTRVPRPTDNYASFNKPGVATDQGVVGTGPIFLTGGHRRLADSPEGLEKAYGGTENTVLDVHVVAGKLGPWFSGYVRPGVPDEAVIAARASRVSGHWVGDRLKAIVCVNSEGFDVPGDGFAEAGFAFSLNEDGVVTELVASLECGDDEGEPDDDLPAVDDGDEPEFDREAAARELTVSLEAQDMGVE